MNQTAESSRIVAAVDLGSNSFHMIVAKLDASGTLSIIDRLRESVRLGGGLLPNGKISKEAMQRALECIDRFGQRVRDLPKTDVRIVGTNTLRVARNSQAFVAEVESRLSHNVEIISGREEARLIYLGVAHGLATRDGQRLVVDIGGGSTELILGTGMESVSRESMYTGCVSSSRRFFADGEITATRMNSAIIDAELLFYPVARGFSAGNWEEAVGCSGTIKAIRNIAHAEGWCESGISLEALYQMRDKIIKQGHVDKIKLASMSDDRAEVLPGGLAVLIGVFETLGIKQMRVSEQALREGLLYDLVGRIQHQDTRDATVESAMKRWNLDIEHASNVTTTVRSLFDQVSVAWNLNEEHADLLMWAAMLHEIGLQISHGAYHKRGAYVLMHADLPGFSRQEQALLATLVLCHRSKFRKAEFDELIKPARKPGRRLCVLLRLAVLLHRGRTGEQVPDVDIRAEKSNVTLHFPQGWLEQHSLSHADLNKERDYLQDAGISLEFS
jgi:exopolyphosphatase / guanosine-5'-triphosphate,3'-diphosphate pyrophosphatase